MYLECNMKTRNEIIDECILARQPHLNSHQRLKAEKADGCVFNDTRFLLVYFITNNACLNCNMITSEREVSIESSLT